MIRATTNGTLKAYRTGLNRSTLRLNSARNTVLTQRNFNSYAESPAAAAESFQLRRSYLRVSAQLDVSQSVARKFDTAYSAIDTVVSLVDNEKEGSALSAILAGASDPTGQGRTALGEQLIQLSESIIESLNCKHGDQFIFSGADGLTVPFSWEGEGDDRQLYFRGYPVDENSDMLKYMDEREHRYVDVGIGLEEDENNNLIGSSAFDSTLQGIGVLGYGVDEDGLPNNIASIVYQMGAILSRCTEDGGAWASEEDQTKFKQLMEKFTDASSDLKKFHVDMSTKADYLANNGALLEDTAYTLNEQILAIEQCDLADAITSFSWAQYCYNAALKMGNSVLSESLMDYLK